MNCKLAKIIDLFLYVYILRAPFIDLLVVTRKAYKC